MKKIYLLTCLPIFIYYSVVGQNLVKNPDFEDYQACPKDFTQWNSVVRVLTTDWTYPTKGTPDYFNKCSYSMAGVPHNFAGRSEAADGNAYIGMILKGSRANYREYAQSQLKQALIAGQYYCITLRYRLSTNSKLATDRLAVHFREGETMVDYDAAIRYTPHIANPLGHFMENKDSWQELCGVYMAQGGEDYLVIGNFFDDDTTAVIETDISMVKSERRQKNYAYYYIDLVSVVPMNTCFVCSCSDKNKIDVNIIPENVRIFGAATGGATVEIVAGEEPFTYLWSNGQNSSNLVDVKAGKYNLELTDANGCSEIFGVEIEQPDQVFAKIDIGVPKTLKNLFFVFDKTDFLTHSQKQLEDLVAFMEFYSTIKIKIVGHTDEHGTIAYNQKLSEERAQKVVSYLIDRGISLNRLSYEGKGKSEPLSKEDSKEAHQINRRVEFIIVSQ